MRFYTYFRYFRYLQTATTESFINRSERFLHRQRALESQILRGIPFVPIRLHQDELFRKNAILQAFSVFSRTFFAITRSDEVRSTSDQRHSTFLVNTHQTRGYMTQVRRSAHFVTTTTATTTTTACKLMPLPPQPTRLGSGDKNQAFPMKIF